MAPERQNVHARGQPTWVETQTVRSEASPAAPCALPDFDPCRVPPAADGHRLDEQAVFEFDQQFDGAVAGLRRLHDAGVRNPEARGEFVPKGCREVGHLAEVGLPVPVEVAEELAAPVGREIEVCRHLDQFRRGKGRRGFALGDHHNVRAAMRVALALRPAVPAEDRRSKPCSAVRACGVTPCAAQSAARAGLKTGAPSRRAITGGWRGTAALAGGQRVPV